MLDLVLERVESHAPESVQVPPQLDKPTNLDAVNPAYPFTALRHQARVFENLEVLRDGWPADREALGEGPH
jgi:hypothetical protein